ncbi:hypothetical protein GPJ56_008447 [Histomonas meleagridis]|uniref:uncharacterized protein n=1 Tax=Histomonas meleagridis TaxID=135588 RepID=UPI00355A80CB|nr:hypothetical protein GPJ56_008447 [Histomonas meleagridis]KAH0806503.1 hypothetical protein GO595_000665 [Histomonas meleagridis]
MESETGDKDVKIDDRESSYFEPESYAPTSSSSSEIPTKIDPSSRRGSISQMPDGFSRIADDCDDENTSEISKHDPKDIPFGESTMQDLEEIAKSTQDDIQNDTSSSSDDQSEAKKQNDMSQISFASETEPQSKEKEKSKEEEEEVKEPTPQPSVQIEETDEPKWRKADDVNTDKGVTESNIIYTDTEAEPKLLNSEKKAPIATPQKSSEAKSKCCLIL